MAAAESYPDDLKYHPEHDWARIDGDEAVLGITWWAQDALGELVHCAAPAVGGLTVIAFPNSHLVYALTRYGMALMLAGAVIYILRGRRTSGRGR